MKMRSGTVTNNSRTATPNASTCSYPVCAICDISDSNVYKMKNIWFQASDTPYIYRATCGCNYSVHKKCMHRHFATTVEDSDEWQCLYCEKDITEYVPNDKEHRMKKWQTFENEPTFNNGKCAAAKCGLFPIVFMAIILFAVMTKFCRNNDICYLDSGSFDGY